MKIRFTKHSQQALTFFEVLTALAVLALILLVILPMLPHHHHGSARISCVNNLKQVGLSFRIYANDNNDLYPMHVPEREGGAMEAVERGEVFGVFLSMSNELSVPKTVVCPSDTRRAATNWNVFSNANLSYFVGLDATNSKPEMLLSGDRNLEVEGKLMSGVVEAGSLTNAVYSSAIHEGMGNIALADGRVQQMSNDLLRQQIKATGPSTNRVVFPQ